jgi:hypothetical protein
MKQEQDNQQAEGSIQLAPEDVRIGQLKYLEIQRLHDLMHAAQADYERWALVMGALYGVPPGYVIGDPAAGFVPAPTGFVEEGHHHG